jgi:hypothetical protein
MPFSGGRSELACHFKMNATIYQTSLMTERGTSLKVNDGECGKKMLIKQKYFMSEKETL